MDCVFCGIACRREYDTITPSGIMTFEPLSPHVPGHLLVVPVRHVVDALEDPVLTGEVFAHAAGIARDRRIQANLPTSAGADATQSVMHLHVHLLPRGPGDGLMTHWPWRCGTVHDQSTGPHAPGVAPDGTGPGRHLVA